MSQTGDLFGTQKDDINSNQIFLELKKFCKKPNSFPMTEQAPLLLREDARLTTVNASNVTTVPTHEPLALALMSVFLLCQLGCICLLVGFCYVGQFTLSFTACCLSGSVIRVGGCKQLANGPMDVEEAVAEQLKKESIKASAKRGAVGGGGGGGNYNSGEVPKSAKKSGKK